EHQRNRVRGPRVEGLDLLRDAPADDLDPIALGEPEVAAQKVTGGEPSNRRTVRRAMGFVHRDSAGSTALEELVAQPALADPRVADHANHLPARLERPREDALQPAELRLPSDQAGEAPEPGGVEPGTPGADASQLEDPDRSAHALQGPEAQVGERGEPRDEARSGLRGAHRSR